MNPKQRLRLKTKAVSTLNKIRYKLLDYYLDANTIFKLQKKY